MSYAARIGALGVPISDEQLTVSDTALNPTIPAGTKGAIVSVDAAARVRFDGSTATASAGHLLALGQFIELGAADLVGASFFSSDGTGPVVVTITYYGD